MDCRGICPSPRFRRGWEIQRWFGNVKQMLCTGGMLVSQMTNKHKLGAWGLVGGGEGKTGATLLKRQQSDDGGNSR